jgi:hypothetical protein
MRQISKALAFLEEEEEEEPIVDSSAVALVELFELLVRCRGVLKRRLSVFTRADAPK